MEVSAIYGQAKYGQARYGNIVKCVSFRYKCGLQITKNVSPRYACLGSMAQCRKFRYEAKGGIIKNIKFRYRAGGWWIIHPKWRYEAKQGVLDNAKFRYATQQGVGTSYKFRYSNSRTISTKKFRYQVVNQLNKNQKFKYTALSERYETVAGGNPSGNPVSSGGGTLAFPYENPIQGSLYATSTEIPESHDLGLASFGVTFTESSPSKWALHILDTTGVYNPRNSASSWYQKMDDEAYVDTTLVKWIRSNLTYGGMPFEYVGVPTDYSWDQDSKSRYFNFIWQGVDKTQVLFTESHTFETVRSKLGSITKAHTIITNILSAFGFVARLDFPDFVVPVMHMQNSKPIEYIKSLLEVMGAEWILEGDNIFHAYLPTQKSSNHNWEFDLSSETKLIENISVQNQMPEVINQVTISRAREVGISTPNEGGEGNEMVCIDFGVYSITFDNPLNGVYMRALEQVGGFFSTFICRDVHGDIVGVIDDVALNYPERLRQATAYNVKSIDFTWGSQLQNLQSPNGIFSTAGYGKIRFYGATNDSFTASSTDVSPTSEFDQTFIVVGKYQDSINKHGLRKVELSPNPLIPNSTIARITATEYLRRIWRNRCVTRYKIPLNFMIRPGDTISEIYEQISLNRKLYVVESSHNFSNEPSERYSSVTAVEYPTTFNVTFS